MNKRLYTSTIFCWLLLLVFNQNSFAQNAKMSVLKMLGSSNHFSYLDTNIDLKSMVLNKGINGQGTIEFWTKFQNDAQQLLITSDATESPKFELLLFRNRVVVQSKFLNITQSISPTVSLNPVWQHFAFNFYKTDNANLYKIDLFVDGVKVTTFHTIEIASKYDLFFSKGLSTSEILLTEIRAWNVARTEEQIFNTRYNTFFNYTGSAIDAQIALGLVANYSGDAELITPNNKYLTELSTLKWKNTIQKTDFPSFAKIVSNAKNSLRDTPLALINSTMGNPIEDLDQIIVTASKGKFNNKVEIQWFHLKDLTTYNIFRDNIKIGTQNNSTNVNGVQLSYIDNDALPGTIYTYKIEGNNNNGTNLKVGASEGFIFPNGTLTGTIKTQSEVYVENVGVEIGLSSSNLGMNGTALNFAANSNKITFVDRQLIVDNNNITIEFWYKNNVANATGNNTVFKLGTTEIVLNASQTILKYNNTLSKTFAIGTSDNLWHHYAYALGTDGIKVYKDKVLVGEATDNFNWATTSTDFNYYLNFRAESAYALDEFRIWKGNRNLETIKKYASYVVDADEKDLLIAYSMDLKGKREVYNHALVSKGSYLGKSTTDIAYTTQPNSLKYVAFTDVNGNYSFSSIYSTSVVGNAYSATAFKPNHEFRPPTVGATLKQSSLVSDYSKVANFTDISALPVAGRIFYLENDIKYPVPVGKRIAIDGNPLLGDVSGLTSNIDGVYSVSSSLGRHAIEVSNPEIQNNKNLNSLSFSPKKVDNKIVSGGYAVSKKFVEYKNQGFTFSGFVKPYVSTELPNFVAEKQTLMNWGKFEIALVNNNKIQLLYSGLLQKETVITNTNAFNFFAFSVSTSGNYGLIVNEEYKSGLISNVSITSDSLYLGASKNSAGTITSNCLSNLSLIEFRNKNYSENDLKAIKNGSVIAGDNLVLDYSFEMDQEKGNRLLSKTKLGKGNYLEMKDATKIDNSLPLNYSSKYKYTYQAVNSIYNPAAGSAKYELNIIEPLTSVDFEMKDRYGFVGNLVIPCDNSIGAWTGKITRTDSKVPQFEKTIDASHFDNENKTFLVEGLIPGQYQVTLTNVANTSLKVISPILDMTKGWESFDFEYRAPLNVDINAYVVKEEKATAPLKDLKIEDFEKLSKVCSQDYYVLAEGTKVLLQAEVYEKYGDSKCFVKGANVTFSGELFKMADGAVSTTEITDVKGIGILYSYTTSPNFMAPHLRNFTIQATHDNRNKVETINGLITGARMNQSDFTIDDPIVNYVLHDPPGDASSATLKKGTKATTTGKWSTGVGYTSTLEAQIGIKHEQDMVATVLGFGTSITAVKADVSSGVDASFKILGTYNGSTVTETENSKEYSTSSSESLVGKKADLFIGTGYLITVGTGEILSYNLQSCSPNYTTNTQVFNNKIDNSFVHSYYDIQKNMIPNLLIAYNNETNANKKESYKNSINKWIDVLLRNDYVLNNYNREDYQFMNDYDFLEEKYNSLPATLNTTQYNWANYPKFKDFETNRSFDGGGANTVFNISKSNASNNGADFESNFDIGYKTVVKGTVVTFNTEFEYKNIVNLSAGGGFEVGEGSETVNSFNFSDSDAGDRFAVEIKQDPNFEVPIFKTLAGQSSCPAERGTQIRTGVEIAAVDPTIANGLSGQTLKYRVKLSNTQIAGNADSAKTYKLSLSSETNPEGAIVTVNGASLVAGGKLDFWFGPDPSSPTGIKKEHDAIIEIKMPDSETRSSVKYKDLEFLFYVPCEGHDDLDFEHNSDVYSAAKIKSIAGLYLTAEFNGPCVADLKMQEPQNNWVVNAQSDNKLDFNFTIPGVTVTGTTVNLPDNLTAVEIEYVIKGNNTSRLLKTITVAELKAAYRDNAFRMNVDVSGLTNGEFGFRLVPVCGLGTETWRRSNPTEYAYGLISRDAPKLLTTNPVENGILTNGSIIATYDKALDPTTLSSLNIALRGVLGGMPKKLISVDFKNKDHQITIPHGEFLNLKSAFTLEFWINPASYPLTNGTNIFNKGTNYGIYLKPNGKLNYRNNGASGDTNKAIPLHEWTHVAAVYDGNATLNFYFNGVLAHTDIAFLPSDLATNTNPLTIGGLTNSEGFIGQLDEIRIWDTNRKDADIKTYSTKQLLGNEANLKAYYTFDNNALQTNGFQEAVRDYAGNTKGSTANGITWIEGDVAAPLQIETVVQDIPVAISTTIDKNQIIINPINFQEYFLEGAKLTAIINGNAVKGVDGNFVAEKSWSFTINKNNVAWNRANIIASQNIGNSITIDAILKNNGGANTTFELQGLPEWIKCNNVTVGNSETLNAGFEKTLNFTTSAYLNKGTYLANIGVITFNQAGAKTGYEYFTLELTVNCQTPQYTFNSSAFANKVDFTAELTIDGIKSSDSNDVVVAYYNDQIRGKGNVTKINGKNVVLLSVFFNSGEENGALTFRVWDDSSCKEYIGLNQIFTFGNGNDQGSLNAPVQFVTGNIIVKRIPLLEGFQWVSFNSINNSNATSLNINNIKGMAVNDEIVELATNKKATFLINGIASGNLTEIDFKKGYQVKSASNKLMLVQGVEAPVNTNISILGGFVNNYIGYIPNVMFNTSYALRSLTNRFTLGDRISGREGFAEFTSEGWKGTLTHMIPNKSYNLKMINNNGILNYSGFITTNTTSRTSRTAVVENVLSTAETTSNDAGLNLAYLDQAAQKGIVVDQFKYPQTMSVTAAIHSEILDTNKEYMVVAKANGEYRGIAKAVVDNGNLVYFMTVYGTNQEDITFHVITEDEAFAADNGLLFNPSSFVGDIKKPYVLQVSKKSVEEQGFTVVPNPVIESAILAFTPSITDEYTIDLYNLIGVKLVTLHHGTIDANKKVTIELHRNKNINLRNLPSGIYLCQVKGANALQTLKVIFQ